MEYAREMLQVCFESNKDVTILYRNQELAGFLKGVNRVVAVLQPFGGSEADLEISLQDIQRILYPVLERTREGVFKIVRQPPPC